MGIINTSHSIVRTILFLQLNDYNDPQIIQPQWTKTLDKAVKICFLTLTPAEKRDLINTAEDNLIIFHFGWAMNMRNEFEM